jgi:hypothetical protein
MGLTFQRSLSVFAGLVLLSSALPSGAPQAVGRDKDLSSAVTTIAPARQVPSSFSPVTFDDFGRTVASGWGTSSSDVAWTDDSFRQNGRTSEEAGNALAVDGLNGRMDLGVGEPVFMRAGSGPWQQPEWTMTARFRVSTVPGTGDSIEVAFWVFTDVPLPYADGPYLWLKISSDANRGQVAINGVAGAPPSRSPSRRPTGRRMSPTRSSGATPGAASRRPRSGRPPIPSLRPGF